MKKHTGRPKSGMELDQPALESLISLYSEGASDSEVKAEICKIRGSFSNDLWDRWLKEEEIFSETVKMGRMLSHGWWERNGRVNLKDGAFNYTGWYMNMKNRFGWADKNEQHNTGTMTINWPLGKTKLDE